jgi:putative oxidoreductase
MTALDIGLLVLRVTVGGIYVLHGLRKLGWGNPDGYAGFHASIARRGYRPPRLWAPAAVVAEIGGGILAILGLLTPVASALLLAQSVTIVALVRGRGFWVEAMGVEYPLMLGAGAVAIALAGPGGMSMDALLGVDVDPLLAVALAAVGVAGSVVGLVTRRPAT